MKQLIYKILNNPRWRTSKFFSAIKKNLFEYTPVEFILDKATEFVKFSDIKGDYLEFGVWEGTSFIRAYHFAQNKNLNDMNFYAFDSFEGLPDLKGEEGNQFKKGSFNCSLEQFKKNLAKQKVNMKKVGYVVGFYETSLKREPIPYIKPASIVYIDCDLYSSAVDVLKFLTKYIQDGTILIFDDWFCFKSNQNKGEQRAFREWLEENKQFTATEFYKFGVHGNSFIINKKDWRK